MISIENQVLTTLQHDLSLLYKDIKVKTPYDVSELKHISLPLVTLEVTDNIESDDGTFDGVENYSTMTFEIQVYTDGYDKKTQSNNIIADIDRIMSNHYGMRRIVYGTLRNLENDNILRKVLNYDCLINNQTYKIYRR